MTSLSNVVIRDVGGVVWDAALVLCAFLEKQNKMIEQRVIELGAGTGVCGLAASLLNAKNVLITDMKDFVPLMEKNIIENKAVIGNRKVEALEVDWRQFCQEEDPENAFEIDGNLRSKLLQGFDVILVSDCIYYER